MSYVLVSSRTTRLEGSEIVIYSPSSSPSSELDSNNSANCAAVTVIDTESDKSSKKLGSETEIEGFVPKLDPKLKVVPLPEETVYISLLDIVVVLKSEIFSSAIVDRTSSLLEVRIKLELRLVRLGSLKNDIEFSCNQS